MLRFTEASNYGRSIRRCEIRVSRCTAHMRCKLRFFSYGTQIAVHNLYSSIRHGCQGHVILFVYVSLRPGADLVVSDLSI